MAVLFLPFLVYIHRDKEYSLEQKHTLRNFYSADFKFFLADFQAQFQATSMEYQLKSIDKFLFFSKINAKSALGRQLPFVGFSYFFYWHDFVIAVHILFFADLCLLLCFFNLLKVKERQNVFLMSTFLPKIWTNKLNFTTLIPQVDLSSFVFWKKLKTKTISKLTDPYLLLKKVCRGLPAWKLPVSFRAVARI